MIWVQLFGLLAVGAVVVISGAGMIWLVYEYAHAPLLDHAYYEAGDRPDQQHGVAL